MPDAVASAAPVLTIELQRCQGDCFVLYCKGRLVAGQTQILTDAVKPLIPQAKRIVLDLSGLQHTDSMGLGTMVRLYASARAGGCSLELMHLSQQLRNLLGLTNLFSIFTVVGENGIKLL